jgi:hypothetical protein
VRHRVRCSQAAVCAYLLSLRSFDRSGSFFEVWFHPFPTTHSPPPSPYLPLCLSPPFPVVFAHPGGCFLRAVWSQKTVRDLEDEVQRLRRENRDALSSLQDEYDRVYRDGAGVKQQLRASQEREEELQNQVCWGLLTIAAPGAHVVACA